MKVNLLKAMFAKNHVMIKQPAFIALKQLYPVHAAYITDVKKADYRQLARKLQRLESSIVIDGVSGYLAKHFSDVPILTIHDELIVPQELADKVEALLVAGFEKHGVTPKVNKDPLC